MQNSPLLKEIAKQIDHCFKLSPRGAFRIGSKTYTLATMHAGLEHEKASPGARPDIQAFVEEFDREMQRRGTDAAGLLRILPGEVKPVPSPVKPVPTRTSKPAYTKISRPRGSFKLPMIVTAALGGLFTLAAFKSDKVDKAITHIVAGLSHAPSEAPSVEKAAPLTPEPIVPVVEAKPLPLAPVVPVVEAKPLPPKPVAPVVKAAPLSKSAAPVVGRAIDEVRSEKVMDLLDARGSKLKYGFIIPASDGGDCRPIYAIGKDGVPSAGPFVRVCNDGGRISLKPM